MPETAVPSAQKKKRLRLYSILSVILLLVTLVLIFFYGFTIFESQWVSRSANLSEDFHKLMYNSEAHTWQTTKWFGTPIQKNPLDLFIFQEIIYETKPDVIVEAGTFAGGSALYMATLLDEMNQGKVITIDIETKPGRPQHPRIQYLLGSSTDPQIVEKVKSAIRPTDKVMVVLDSDHRKKHVLNELLIYSKMVTKGNYLILEDTNINGHPVAPYFGPGPMEALQEYLKDHSDLEIDKTRERLFVTFNPNGYLRKVL